MVKNHHLAKFVSDVSWYELTRQLEYTDRRIMTDSIRKIYIGLVQSEYTPVEIVGYEVDEAESHWL